MNLDPAFYKALEDRFRGDADTMDRKFSVYDPLLERFETSPSCTAVDLGCGRGEWLARLKARHWTVQGVESNPEMCAEAKRSGVDVVEDDLLRYLKAKADDSVDLLSAFHVIEHLPIEYMIELFSEAFRVLSPRGVLVFETPNPENIRVGTDLFYLDPTHHKPLSPEFVQFTAAWAGFPVAEILRMHSPRLYSPDALLGEHMETFLNYSPDYACIASKDAAFAEMDVWLEGDLGPSNPRFYAVVDQLHQDLKSTDHWLASENQRLGEQVDHLQAQINHLVEALWHSRRRSIGWQLAEWRGQLISIQERIGQRLNDRIKGLIRQPFAYLAAVVVRRPRLKRLAVKCLNRVPMMSRFVGRILATERSRVGHIGIDGVAWRAEARQLTSTRERHLFQLIQRSSD